MLCSLRRGWEDSASDWMGDVLVCVTIIWAIRSDQFTDAFQDLSQQILGVRPVESAYRLASSRVPRPFTTFSVTRNVCDCDGVIGSKDREQVLGEIPARAFVSWLGRVPEVVPSIRRIVLVNAWSPPTDISPTHSKTIGIADVTERFLRWTSEGTLIAIDYPKIKQHLV